MIFNWDQNNKIVKLGNDEHVLARQLYLRNSFKSFCRRG